MAECPKCLRPGDPRRKQDLDLSFEHWQCEVKIKAGDPRPYCQLSLRDASEQLKVLCEVDGVLN